MFVRELVVEESRVYLATHFREAITVSSNVSRDRVTGMYLIRNEQDALESAE
jgi:hypothetical protein